jgi:hypothetical protein
MVRGSRLFLNEISWDPMQQATTKKLYAYWNAIRNGRIAPKRFEVDPSKISELLRETFIVECSGASACRFRLAGTEVCQYFGRELRGEDLLSLWSPEDRRTISLTLETIIGKGAVGHGTFFGITESNRDAPFEFALMPLAHTGLSLSHILGTITAIDRPFWIGAHPIAALELRDVGVHWPIGSPDVFGVSSAEAAQEARRRFRILPGGLSR